MHETEFPSILFFVGLFGKLAQVMPRKNPIPEGELQICRRIRNFRTSELGMSQAAAARKLGIDSTRLAAYEHGRVPIRFGFADRFCKKFNLSQLWLAEGKERPIGYVRFDPALKSSLNDAERFSAVWISKLRPAFVEARQSGLETIIDAFSRPPRTFPRAEEAMRFQVLMDFIRNHLRSFSPPVRWSFLRVMQAAASDFVLREKKPTNPADDDWEELDKKKETSVLTNVNESVKYARVKSLMANLLGRLRRATRERGKKSELAADLKVPLPSVSQWLSGEREPGGETTLKLLHWVERQEHK